MEEARNDFWKQFCINKNDPSGKIKKFDFGNFINTKLESFPAMDVCLGGITQGWCPKTSHKNSFRPILLTSIDLLPWYLRFLSTSTTNFKKTSLTWETDYYSYKKLTGKNSGFRIRKKSGRVATLFH